MEFQYWELNQNRIKIYYTENADATEDINVKNNNWEETINDIKNVKKYLVCVDKLDVAESIELSYDVMIPGDLEYNLSSKEGYEVYYTNKTISKKIELDDVTLATPKGATIETTLKALVAGEEKNEVKENEVLRYEATISNVGSEDYIRYKIISKCTRWN